MERGLIIMYTSILDIEEQFDRYLKYFMLISATREKHDMALPENEHSAICHM